MGLFKIQRPSSSSSLHTFLALSLHYPCTILALSGNQSHLSKYNMLKNLNVLTHLLFSAVRSDTSTGVCGSIIWHIFWNFGLKPRLIPWFSRCLNPLLKIEKLWNHWGFSRLILVISFSEFLPLSAVKNFQILLDYTLNRCNDIRIQRRRQWEDVSL